jgi:predicted ATPase
VLTVLAVEGYRSLRDVVLPLGQLTVVTGANGSGKSSVYRVLRLLAGASRGGIVPALAREGGLGSVLWAGPEGVSREVREGVHPVQGTRRRGPVTLRAGFAGDEYGYAVDLGLPAPPPSWAPTMFGRDPRSSGRPSGRAPSCARPASSPTAPARSSSGATTTTGSSTRADGWRGRTAC